MQRSEQVIPNGAETAARPTPRPGGFSPPRPVHTPSALAITDRARADRWKVLALCLSFGSLVLAYAIVKAGRATESIYVMDPAGNIYAGPIEPLAESRGFFQLTAIYATNAALQRSPAGFDLSELVKLYYTPRAAAKLQDDQQQRQDDIRRRNLQWKPLIDSISDPVPAGSGRIVEVRGRVVMAGAFANRSFYDEATFTLVLTLIRNPDLGQANAYPWVCHDVDLKVTNADRPRR